MASHKFLAVSLCILMLACVFIDEVEGRRKILRGRKTINRTYYKQSAIPAWATIVLVGGAELIVAGIVYVLLNKFYVGDLESADNSTYQGVNQKA